MAFRGSTGKDDALWPLFCESGFAFIQGQVHKGSGLCPGRTDIQPHEQTKPFLLEAVSPMKVFGGCRVWSVGILRVWGVRPESF